jgi:hypothetical protein
MNAIGVHCYYIGPHAALRNRRATILGVVRGKRADGSPYIETDDTEFEHDPIVPTELVQVHIAERTSPALVSAVELDVFRHLALRLTKMHILLEEGIAQELLFAARHLARPLDALINDAVAAYMRALGVDRTRWTTLVGLPVIG